MKKTIHTLGKKKGGGPFPPFFFKMAAGHIFQNNRPAYYFKLTARHTWQFSQQMEKLMRESIPYVPKKITIGLSAWITLKVVSESKNDFKLWKYDYFSTFQWRPHLIWSSNHKEIWIFVKQVTGPFVPSFAIRMYMAFTDTLRSQHTDLQTFQILCIPFQQRLILTTF